MATVLPFDGHTPQIDPTAWLAPTATVIGRVTIGPRASVFYGAVLRGDMDEIVLGAGSNLQDNCVVHTDDGVPTRIGAGVGVGHGAIVHGATVGDGSLIGMGATLLNGSVIGEGAFVAAGALVREGQEIPAGHLAVGVPAKDRGELDAAGKERVASNAVHYEALALKHRESVG
ncbi:gamma carbonic anhydrase family protein [Xylanimonas ulmi]|uniref:Carbonic anhydrase/acetyltransferase-like protein (Isoleucine patch superfamily) n=1 Tax=Xylanimonas ulmi TaxID=228973 RepID=A0A4Q7M862_9MICO|nr:gamma carbonic anhydrase family protein [Xylanibacterium ulmi]RZS62329.1 carbonic anhydrase/acetyltransferase-like protein (isoleucine patch superfamily) [Xylanibacterium ulmi]